MLRGDAQGSGETPSYVLFDSYVRHAIRVGRKRRSIETAVGTFLKKMVPGLERGSMEYRKKTVLTYIFPDLAACREAFASMTRRGDEWDEPYTWQSDPFEQEEEEMGEQEFTR